MEPRSGIFMTSPRDSRETVSYLQIGTHRRDGRTAIVLIADYPRPSYAASPSIVFLERLSRVVARIVVARIVPHPRAGQRLPPCPAWRRAVVPGATRRDRPLSR